VTTTVFALISFSPGRDESSRQCVVARVSVSVSPLFALFSLVKNTCLPFKAVFGDEDDDDNDENDGISI